MNHELTYHEMIIQQTIKTMENWLKENGVTLKNAKEFEIIEHRHYQNLSLSIEYHLKRNGVLVGILTQKAHWKMESLL